MYGYIYPGNRNRSSTVHTAEAGKEFIFNFICYTCVEQHSTLKSQTPFESHESGVYYLYTYYRYLAPIASTTGYL